MKLIATSVNAVGLAFVALGVVRPIVDPAFGPAPESGAYALIGLVLHGLALYIVSQVEIDE